MPITEHLMRAGTWSLRLRPETPASITRTIYDLVDEDAATGVGGHIVVTPTRLEPTSISDADLLSQASYTGRITKRPSRLSISGVGLGSWLDTYIDAAISRVSGTPANWLTDLLVNDLSQGTVNATGTSNVSKSFAAYVTTHREALDVVAGLGGWEYRILPDFTVDAAVATTLFASPPTVVVTRREEGDDGEYRGVDGGLIDQAVDVSKIITKAVVLAEGAGSEIVTGSATTTPNLNAPKGSAPDLVAVVSSPGEESGNANSLATNFLNLQSLRREVRLTSTTHNLDRIVVPGDEVYVFDPETGLFDPTNDIHYRGETISPAVVRVLSHTRPLLEGSGVFLRSNEATPTVTDLTDWIAWERGETWWTVGDWSPGRYGRLNRRDPEVETRLSAGPFGVEKLRVDKGLSSGDDNLAISFSDDNDTGIFSSATGALDLIANNGGGANETFMIMREGSIDSSNAEKSFVLRKSTSQAISDETVTVITFDIEESDPSGMHTGSNGYVTIPNGASGTWIFTLTTYWGAPNLDAVVNTFFGRDTSSPASDSSSERYGDQSVIVETTGTNYAIQLTSVAVMTVTENEQIYALGFQNNETGDSSITMPASRRDLNVFSGAMLWGNAVE